MQLNSDYLHFPDANDLAAPYSPQAEPLSIEDSTIVEAGFYLAHDAQGVLANGLLLVTQAGEEIMLSREELREIGKRLDRDYAAHVAMIMGAEGLA